MSNIEKLADDYGLTVTEVTSVMEAMGYNIKEYNELDDYMYVDDEVLDALDVLNRELYGDDDDDSENFDGEYD